MQIQGSLRWGLRVCIFSQLLVMPGLLCHGPYTEQQGSEVLADATIGKRNEGDENYKGNYLQR